MLFVCVNKIDLSFFQKVRQLLIKHLQSRQLRKGIHSYNKGNKKSGAVYSKTKFSEKSAGSLNIR